MLFFFSFGWAKPVMVDPTRFKNPRRDMMWVALAGPVSNIVLAFVLSPPVPVHHARSCRPARLRATWMFLQVTIQLNIWLAVFNMLPLPPLDGSKVLAGILPRRYAYRYARLETYGTVILLLLVVSGMLLAACCSRPIQRCRGWWWAECTKCAWRSSKGRWTCCCT